MATVSAKSVLQQPRQGLTGAGRRQQKAGGVLRLRRRPISAVRAAEPAKTPSPAAATAVPAAAAPAAAAAPGKWTLESWKGKEALQLPEYPDKAELESVLRTLEAFPPIVFAGEARSLEERLGEAAMGRAFLLQGGDCAESFKEFNANNIRDTFRILLQMGAVLTFGGQMPVIKVCSPSPWSPISADLRRSRRRRHRDPPRAPFLPVAFYLEIYRCFCRSIPIGRWHRPRGEPTPVSWS